MLTPILRVVAQAAMVSSLYLGFTSLAFAADQETYQLIEGQCIGWNTKRPGLNKHLIGPCTDLRNKNLYGQSLNGFNLESSDFYRINLSAGTISGSKLDSTNLCEADFRKIQCKESSFKQASLRGLAGQQSLWKECHFHGADLRAANLYRAQFQQSSLRGADLRSAFLVYTSFLNSDLRGANLEDAILLQTNFKGSTFDRSTRLPFSEQDALRRGMKKVED